MIKGTCCTKSFTQFRSHNHDTCFSYCPFVVITVISASPTPYVTVSGYITTISGNSFIHTDMSLARRDVQCYPTCFMRLTGNSPSSAALLSSFSSTYFFPSNAGSSILAHHNVCRRSTTCRSLKEIPCPVLLSALLCLHFSMSFQQLCRWFWIESLCK